MLDAGNAYADRNPPATIHSMARPFQFPRTNADHIAGRRTEGMVQAHNCGVEGHLENLGRIERYARLACRPEPAEGLPNWPGGSYACWRGDLSAFIPNARELYDFIRDRRIEGFVTVSGDRHSFWAGYAAKALPPKAFEPVGVAFICGSISAPGMAEAVEHRPKDDPLSPLFVVERPGGRFETTVNLTLRHGVRSALEYARSGDLAAARRLSNPANAPHL